MSPLLSLLGSTLLIVTRVLFTTKKNKKQKANMNNLLSMLKEKWIKGDGDKHCGKV